MGNIVWNDHVDLRGKHALLSPSSHFWIKYDPQKLENYIDATRAMIEGTELHEIASMLIRKKIFLPNTSDSLNRFVNDAIAMGMRSEQPLKYSKNIFGTADAISFYSPVLRVHDLKTGKNPANMDQLLIYAALFCLEYGYDPRLLEIELRIYQNSEIRIEKPTGDDMLELMNKIEAANIVAEDHLARRMQNGLYRA